MKLISGESSMASSTVKWAKWRRARLIEKKKDSLGFRDSGGSEVSWNRGWELLFQTSRRRRGSQLRISEVIKSPEMEQNKDEELISRNLYRTCRENSLTCCGWRDARHGSLPFRETPMIFSLSLFLPPPPPSLLFLFVSVLSARSKNYRYSIHILIPFITRNQFPYNK